ncbi:NADP-dependent aldehyde dehydrogenase [Curtobacterium sp. PhB130]|uniref:aldehyde dehydrogenase (NADP(+)) n=1 Tax=unclassified Curtobacterium TaxID=257496 RepID=UPI000F4C5EDF|nr:MULTISPECIES: aldehyde dehydrogenase (NADP(+)) [unclassified Curtobacterium]ROS71845.1 NADP-dependent aldehyde dehydrogenase [Curtobacterium sp. PhB130]TCK58239.1 NADP-dependent aldehyde dehydrogenase [Curtobacterium sp. PhB136]
MTPELDSILTDAANASTSVAGSTPSERATWLRVIADGLDAAVGELVDLATRETHLEIGRLEGEVARTSFQLRFTADAVVEGSWLEVTIDHADAAWPVAPRPDLRRMLQPVGPVLVVAASNFPFAFSVAGGDTATALGAGCPVIVKAHPGHPLLSRRTAQIVTDALRRAGAPEGTFAIIEGEDEAREALADTRVKAGSFTGSVRGGRALLDIASARPDPIPFYGELGSVNPVLVLPSALANRRRAVLEGFVNSFTLSAGQFCTKPGVIFVPRASGVQEELTDLVAAVSGSQLLNPHIMDGFNDRIQAMQEDWSQVQRGASSDSSASPSLFEASMQQARSAPDALFAETFGPAAVLIQYDDPAELVEVIATLPGQLTATVHSDDNDPAAQPIIHALIEHAGRIVWNGWPTGVSVTWAMHHGGTWPSTTASLHTSVGPTAIRRFVRPIAVQGLPAKLLPPAVRDDNPWNVWRRVNGVPTGPVTERTS